MHASTLGAYRLVVAFLVSSRVTRPVHCVDAIRMSPCLDCRNDAQDDSSYQVRDKSTIREAASLLGLLIGWFIASFEGSITVRMRDADCRSNRNRAGARERHKYIRSISSPAVRATTKGCEARKKRSSSSSSRVNGRRAPTECAVSS